MGCSGSMSYKNNQSNFRFLTAGLKLLWQTGRAAIFPPKENFLYLTKAEAGNINGPFNTQEKTHLQSQIYAAGHFVLHCVSAAGGRPWRELRNQPPRQTISGLSARKVSSVPFKRSTLPPVFFVFLILKTSRLNLAFPRSE